MPTLSGEQHVLTLGRQRAVVTEVGASLRVYDVDAEPVCWGFAEDELSSGGRGQVLAPWPGRIEDGSYRFDGIDCKVPIDEPDRGNAIHGLVRWLAFTPVERAESSVRLRARLHPQPAYPFDLELDIAYELEPGGLTVRTLARNLGWRRAPFGIGFHDYLDAGPGRVDALAADVHAERRLLLDGRNLPVGEEPVAGTPYGVVSPDGPEPGPIGSLRLDDCFTGLRRGADGRWRAEVHRGAGPLDKLVVWSDAAFAWAMVYSGDTLVAEHRRLALAIEPMTCPPNAFRSGEGLVVLDPGEVFSATWGIAVPALG